MNTPHPATALTPPVEGPAYDALKADIERNGLKQAIVVYNWKIVDGRARFNICKELGVTPRYEFIAENPVGYAWQANAHRRAGMNKSQLAIVALRAIPLLMAEIEARARPPAKPKTEATLEAGRIFGASKTQIGEARQLQEQEPELFAEVEAGRLSLNKATIMLRHKAKQADTPKVARSIRDLAASGYRAAQIADELSMKVVRVRQLSRQYGIELPDDRQLRHAGGFKVKDAIENTVTGLEGYATGLEAIKGAKLPFTASEAQELVISLAQSLKPIQRLRRELLEISNGEKDESEGA